MADVATLLPHNATGAESALEQSTAYGTRLPEPIRALWNPDTCPAALLPWLAWSLSVDEWDAGWPEDVKRAAIRASVGVHRRKGTPGAVLDALRSAGYGEAVIIERFGHDYYDGARLHDGSITYAPPDHWAEYRVKLDRPISNAQANQVRAILSTIAPARSHLKVLDFQEVAHLYSGEIQHNGEFNYGAA